MSYSTPPRPWHLASADPARKADLRDLLGCPPAIAHLLATRGLTPEACPAFFTPALDHLHAPGLMLGMAPAVHRIFHAVAAREPILIYGDYDVDGTTATVLLKTAIDRLSPGQPSLVSWHIPHRIREGYGLQGTRLAEAHAAGVRLVISVDTGVRAFAAAEQARYLGLDLIVTDHHLPDGTAGVPDAVAVINPAQAGCPYPYKQLCGAAVAFKLAHALLETNACQQPDRLAAERFLHERLLPSLLKLVALATVADAVPLTGENRTLAALGLAGLARPVQPGLRALMEVAGLTPGQPPTASEIGFRIGPRINAAGRMDIADLVIDLLLTRSEELATDLAQQLDRLNQDRKTVEREALLTIETSLADLAPDGQFPAECLILDHPDWHRGVLGILASRVVERSGLPALVLSHEGEECHGSGRSITGFHLLDALSAAHALATPGETGVPLFSRFGGHAHAVGFSLPRAHLPRLRQRLRAVSTGLLSPDLRVPPLALDAEVLSHELTPELAMWLSRCEPFGTGNPEPRLLLRDLCLATPPRVIQEQHLCLSFTPAPGCPPLQALAWSRRGRNWAALTAGLLTPGTRLDLVGRLRSRAGTWFTGLEIELDDLRPALR